MRLAAAIFIAIHGVGHIIWFFSTWIQRALGKDGRSQLEARRPYLLVDPQSRAGRIVGLISLAVILGFAATAWGVWNEKSWWPMLLIASAATSMIVILMMWNPIYRLSLRALLADVGLTAAALLPWGERILGTH